MPGVILKVINTENIVKFLAIASRGSDMVYFGKKDDKKVDHPI